MPLPAEMRPKVDSTVRPRYSSVGGLDSRRSGAPCGTTRTRSGGAMPWATIIRRAVWVNTVVTTAWPQSRRSTDNCSSDGSDSTVCSVTTSGWRRPSASSRTASPAGPPNSPNSCSMHHHVDVGGPQHLGGGAVTARIVAGDGGQYLGAGGSRSALVEHRHDVDAAAAVGGQHRGAQVTGEDRDPAGLRCVGRDDGQPHEHHPFADPDLVEISLRRKTLRAHYGGGRRQQEPRAGAHANVHRVTDSHSRSKRLFRPERHHPLHPDRRGAPAGDVLVPADHPGVHRPSGRRGRDPGHLPGRPDHRPVPGPLDRRSTAGRRPGRARSPGQDPGRQHHQAAEHLRLGAAAQGGDRRTAVEGVRPSGLPGQPGHRRGARTSERATTRSRAARSTRCCGRATPIAGRRPRSSSTRGRIRTRWAPGHRIRRPTSRT